MERILSLGARQQLEPGQFVNIVLGDGAGIGVRRVERLRRCGPYLANQLQLEKKVLAEANVLGIDQARRVSLTILVQADGTVGDARVERSSGRLDLDLAAAKVIRAAVFDPARVEGIPISLWVTFPLTFLASSIR
jgi:TonB family protein